MIIPKRFKKKIETHLLGNMLEIEDYPLILAIMGKPGMGKTLQLRNYLETLGVKVFSISSADLESERAGAPAKLLKKQYVEASINISKNNPSALVIDDIDTTVGEWEQNTGTVNHQGILAFLMHIADNPYFIEELGKINRVPIFFTGNNFELLYEPLRRPGRTLEFEWEPKPSEKIAIIASCLPYVSNAKEIAEQLIRIYPNQSISYFTNLFVTRKLELLSEFSSDITFKKILSNDQYKRQLYRKYIQNYNSTNWKDILLLERNTEDAENTDKYKNLYNITN